MKNSRDSRVIGRKTSQLQISERNDEELLLWFHYELIEMNHRPPDVWSHCVSLHLLRVIVLSGHFTEDISDSVTGALPATSSWQTRQLYASPPLTPTESQINPDPMSRASWQTRPLIESPTQSGTVAHFDDLPTLGDRDTLAASNFEVTAGLNAIEGSDLAAIEDNQILTGSNIEFVKLFERPSWQTVPLPPSPPPSDTVTKPEQASGEKDQHTQ